MQDSVRLVIGSGALVRADVSRVVLDILAASHALALAALVEALLVRSGVLAGVRQTVDASDVHGRLHTTSRHVRDDNSSRACMAVTRNLFRGGGSPFLLSLSFLSRSFPRRKVVPHIQLRDLGSAVSFPSGERTTF